MIVLLKVSNIIVVAWVKRKITIVNDKNPPESVFVSASLLKRRNCIEAKRSHFLRNYLKTAATLGIWGELYITYSKYSKRCINGYKSTIKGIEIEIEFLIDSIWLFLLLLKFLIVDFTFFYSPWIVPRWIVTRWSSFLSSWYLQSPKNRRLNAILWIV